MKYQADEKRGVCGVNICFKGYVRMLPVFIVLFVLSLLASGCATGKGEQKVTGIASNVHDAPTRSGIIEKKDSITSAGGSKKEPEPLVQEKEPSARSNKAQETKRHAELKPLLAVMSEKAEGSISNRDQGPKVHVELGFDNADLYEVLDVTLYELFNVNYMVDPSIKTKVTFHLSGSFTKHQFINILNNVLQLNNLAIVKGPGDIFKVVRRSSSAGFANAPLTEEEEPDQAGDITRMIRLRYIAAETAAKNIKPFLSNNAVVVQDTFTNSLIITDTVDNLAKAASILSMMDVEYFSDISWQVFPIKEADASLMAKDLSGVLTVGGLYNRPGMDKGSFEIVPIKTMNALLVVTRWPAMLKLIEDWITTMDHAEDSGTDVFVYFVENGTATELADILKQLYGGIAKDSSKKVAIVKPTDRTELAGELYGEVEIIPDETNNAIVFKATGRDYRTIKEVLKKLDIVPRQVLINVVIAEISLSGSLEYGVQWYLKDRAQSNYKVQGAYDEGIERAIDTALGTGIRGLTISIFDEDDFLRGLIYALETEGDVNILSSPNILAVDNKEAVIEVGEQVPIPTGEAITDGGTTVKTIQYRDTGVLLTVTPHINSSGMIKIELVQEVSEVGTQDELLEAYSFLNRRAQTSLVIEDGQTIVIGGLMRSKVDTGRSGVPFLKDIPLLGYLFGGKSKDVTKVELIFLITPRIINTREEADAITSEFSERVNHVKELINKKEF